MDYREPDDELLELMHGKDPIGAEAEKIIARTRGARRLSVEVPPEDAMQRKKRAAQIPFEVDPIERPDRQRFPISALPLSAQRFCTEASHALQAEPDMLALFALGHMSGAIGFSRRLYLKDGWYPPANLWIAVVAEPGMLKTPSLHAASKPLYRHQEKLLDEYDSDLRRHEANVAAWERMPVGERTERPLAPTASQHMIVDTTIEALATLLGRNPRGVMLSRDELSGWIRSMGEYKGGGGHDRSDWLSCYGVDMAIIVNRQRAEMNMRPLTVWHPWVAICGGLQPSVVPELRANDGNDDGMMDRFLFGWPAPVVREWNEDTVDRATRDNYDAMFDKLLALDMYADEDTGKPAPTLLPMTSRAHDLWTAAYNEHHAEARKPSFDQRLLGVWSKLDEQAARLALVVHLGRYADGTAESETVDERSILCGWTLADYFKDGAMRARDMVGADALGSEIERVLAYMKRRDMASITLRDMVSSRLVKEATHGRSLLLRMQDRGVGTVEEILAGSRLRCTLTLPDAADPKGMKGSHS